MDDIEDSSDRVRLNVSGDLCTVTDRADLAVDRADVIGSSVVGIPPAVRNAKGLTSF